MNKCASAMSSRRQQPVALVLRRVALRPPRLVPILRSCEGLHDLRMCVSDVLRCKGESLYPRMV